MYIMLGVAAFVSLQRHSTDASLGIRYMGGAPLEREETVDALGVLCEILHCKRCYVCILGFCSPYSPAFVVAAWPVAPSIAEA